MRTSSSTGRWSSSGAATRPSTRSGRSSSTTSSASWGRRPRSTTTWACSPGCEGRWDEAVELYDKGRQLRIRIGDEVDAATGTHNIAEVLSDQGRLEEARPLFEEALRVWRAADFGIGVAYRDQQPRHASPAAAASFDRAAELYDRRPRAVPRDGVRVGAGRHRRPHRRGSGVPGPQPGGDRAGVGARWSGRLPAAAPRRTRCCAASAATRWHRAAIRPAPATSCAAASRSARSRNARYEVALTLDAIARVAEARRAARCARRGQRRTSCSPRSGSCSCRRCPLEQAGVLRLA